jgi:topoisomerase (fragment)
MFFPEYQYEQTIIITLVGDERLKTTETVLKIPGWLVLIKDNASVLDRM